jgi:hypothetical protein
MNTEIKEEDWTRFSRRSVNSVYRWNTRIEVLSGELGDQILIDKAPLNGITVQTRRRLRDYRPFGRRHEKPAPDPHIKDPSKVAFLKTESRHGAIVNIEQPDGTKTLIHFLEAARIAAWVQSDGCRSGSIGLGGFMKGFNIDIENETVSNANFRKVLYTSENSSRF